jgi:hypothetical protein
MLKLFPEKVQLMYSVDDPTPCAVPNGTVTICAGILPVGFIDQAVVQVAALVEVSTFNVYGVA